MAATLVIRPEKLGDLVVATPVFRAFKESFPRDELHVLTDNLHASVIAKDPHVDRIIPIDWRGRRRGQHLAWREILRLLSGTNYRRAAILYTNCDGWNWLCGRLGIRHVAQLGGTACALLRRHRMVLRKGYEDGRHFSELYLGVAAALGATTSSSLPVLYIDADEVDRLRTRFEISNSRLRVLLHPFGLTTYANFSLPAYVRLAQELASKLDAEVYVLGTKTEANLWPEVDDRRIRRDWLGTLTLREVLVAAKLVDLAIGGSSGIIHSAAAAGTPTIGLYCPSGNHVTAWRPLGSAATVLCVPPQLCRRMTRVNSACNPNGICDISFAISATSVIGAAEELLAACARPR